jgi:hypothetical protein
MTKQKYRNTRNGKVGYNTPEQAALFPHLELVADVAKPALPEMFHAGFSNEKREVGTQEEKETEVTKPVQTSKRKGGDK